MAKPAQTRRRFIATLTTVIAGFLALGKFLRPKIPAHRTVITVPRKDIPVRGALVYREARVAVVRDGDSIYALGLVCTHLGCTVTVTPTDLVCPCHGSRFDRQGLVLKGPADRPLRRHTVQEQDGVITVLV